MILIVAIDDRNGMAFNKRRLSQDKELCKRMLECVGDGKLLMNSYSKKLFLDNENVIVDENFLDNAGTGDYYFAETTDVSGYDFEKIVLYRWNRRYPSDLKFNIDLSEYTLESSTDFAGAAHDNITEEVYVR